MGAKLYGYWRAELNATPTPMLQFLQEVAQAMCHYCKYRHRCVVAILPGDVRYCSTIGNQTVMTADGELSLCHCDMGRSYASE